MAKLTLVPIESDEDGLYIEVPPSSRIIALNAEDELLVEEPSNDDIEDVRIPLFKLVANDEVPDGAEFQTVFYEDNVGALYAQLPAVELVGDGTIFSDLTNDEPA